MRGLFLTFWQRYRYSLILLKQLVVTDFKLRYKGSVLGYLWTLLRPLALFVILYVVFVYFLKIGAGVPHFAVYLLLGIVFWNYFTEVTVNGVSAIVGKGDLLRKLAFPRYVVVISGSVSALINLLLNLIVVGVFMIASEATLTWSALLAIPLIIELFVLALAIAFILSALYVRFRDINYIWEVILQAGFYATPILYPVSQIASISETAAKLALLNPVAQIIQDARAVIVTDQSVTVASIFGSGYARLIPIGIVLLLALTAVVYFRRQSPRFAEEI